MTKCAITGCNLKYYARGFCHNHYEQNRKTGNPIPKRNSYKDCMVPGCKRRTTGTFCKYHTDKFLSGKTLDENGKISNSRENNPRWNGGTSEYLRHYDMKKTRQALIDLYGSICKLCGKESTPIYVHHKDLSKTNHSPDNLVLLCPKCHAQVHAFEREKHKSINDANV